jgi:hypothetical protein
MKIKKKKNRVLIIMTHISPATIELSVTPLGNENNYLELLVESSGCTEFVPCKHMIYELVI